MPSPRPYHLIAIPRSITIALLALALLAPGRAGAQRVHGVVVAHDTGDPVPGAIVVMADIAGARRGIALADSLGRFAIAARLPGRYTLVAERVGYASLQPDTITLPAGSLEVQLRAGARRVALPVLTARARSRCAGILDGGPQVAEVWEEARKALAGAALLEESGGYRFTAQVDRRETNLTGSAVITRKTALQTSTGTAFLTLPPDLLVRGGYVVFDADSMILYGVSAAVVLSDEFREYHCFGLRDGGAERIGLEFVPLRTIGPVDVRGVLWLDRATAELRTLEFTYTGLDFRGPTRRLGGELEFRRLPNGAWIVPRWTVRGPLLRSAGEGELRPGEMSHYRVRALLETTGQVLSVMGPDGRPVRLN